jgi:hypothetical protein
MKASRKALLLGLCMAASAVALPTIASAGVAIDIDIAPPPLRVETVPPPRVGFVCARVLGLPGPQSRLGCGPLDS